MKKKAVCRLPKELDIEAQYIQLAAGEFKDWLKDKIKALNPHLSFTDEHEPAHTPYLSPMDLDDIKEKK